jgi:predicted MFS family arabinose efflux permease
MVSDESPIAAAAPAVSRLAGPSRITPAEWGLLLVLAAVQFTHILDFVLLMPLGPAFKTSLTITSQQFAWLVSAYGFGASASGLLACGFLDRFDRKRSLLVLYAGFTVGTLLCGAAPDFPLLVVARAVTGGFAGVMAANVLAIVGDVFPDSRRGQAMGVIMSSFSVASIVGVPLGLVLANGSGWRAPFVVLGLVSVPVLLLAARWLPPLRGHLSRGTGRTVGIWEVLTRPAHLRAYGLMTALVFSSFTIVPYLSIFLVNNVGRSQEELPYVWLCGGLATLLTMTPVGRLADRYGKLSVFRVFALLAAVPALVVTNLSPVPLGITLLATTLFMIATAGRMVPAMAMITASAAPRYRGSFMSLNSSVQQLVMAVAPLVAAVVLGAEAEGESSLPLTGFNWVGWMAAGAMVLSVFLAGRLQRAEEPEGKPAPLAVLEESPGPLIVQGGRQPLTRSAPIPASPRRLPAERRAPGSGG